MGGYYDCMYSKTVRPQICMRIKRKESEIVEKDINSRKRKEDP